MGILLLILGAFVIMGGVQVLGVALLGLALIGVFVFSSMAVGKLIFRLLKTPPIW